MPKPRTTEERTAYMRAWRAEKKRKQQESQGLQEPGATPTHETPVADTVDTSTAVAPEAIIPLPYDVTPEQVAFKRAEYERIKPSFLAAPDDDCAACGHDRQTYHLNAGGVCWAPAPNTRSRRCDCPSYVSAAEPF